MVKQKPPINRVVLSYNDYSSCIGRLGYTPTIVYLISTKYII